MQCRFTPCNPHTHLSLHEVLVAKVWVLIFRDDFIRVVSLDESSARKGGKPSLEKHALIERCRTSHLTGKSSSTKTCGKDNKRIDSVVDINDNPAICSGSVIQGKNDRNRLLSSLTHLNPGCVVRIMYTSFRTAKIQVSKIQQILCSVLFRVLHHPHSSSVAL